MVRSRNWRKQLGPIAKSRLTGWRDLLVSPKYRTLPEHEKLTVVNDHMNRTLFVDDIKRWGKEDYWATPTEFLSTSLWLAKEQSGRAQQVGGSDRIGHWRDLQARLRAAM